ncbi:MAG: YifB family Mg chelatase-like AAA ATPase [Nakamurella sp.]
MALARTLAVQLDGLDGHLVSVEADLANGLPGTTVIGMGDIAVQQSRDRVKAAVVNSGQTWPDRRITLALSPASLRKNGSGFDLAIAVAVLVAAEVVGLRRGADTVWIGELGLDGQVRAVRGVLPALVAARRAGVRVAVVPLGNVAEAGLVHGLEVLGAATLREVITHLSGGVGLTGPGVRVAPDRPLLPDMADVLGQPEGRAALELAAAGGHHLSMIGPPGAGKTMLAARLPSILPALTGDQALEVTAVHSVAGVLAAGMPLVTAAPFVDPHHTASAAAIIGGGSTLIRPGSISLAHRGVLFLDEAPEFKPKVLDALRQPLESGEVMIARAAGAVRYPARFQLVLAANPCPCAAARDLDCRCEVGLRRRYLSRLSGPLMDRVDIRIQLPALDPVALGSGEPGEPSAAIAERVLAARDRAAYRWQDTPWRYNAEVSGAVLRRRWRPSGEPSRLLDRAVRAGLLTGRGYDRVLRLSLTAADLACRDEPTMSDVATALSLRSSGQAA